LLKDAVLTDFDLQSVYYPGSRSHGGRQKTRDRFLDAAREVFGRVGYHAATVEDVLKVSGGGRATFYTYFESKSDLATCLFEQCLPRAIADYEKLAQSPALTRQVVRDWLADVLVGVWTWNRVPFEALNHAMSDNPNIAHRHYRFIATAVTPLTRGWEGPHHAEAQLRATLIVLQWERFCWHWLIQRVQHDRDMVLDVVSEMWYDQLKILRQGPPSPREQGDR
jgi:AcrR family transcriptional regulator